jgi:RNA polymerase-binding transcription factor DksA
MIAVVFYVEDDSSRTTDGSNHSSPDALTTTRITRIRQELDRELAQLKRSFAEAWPREAHTAVGCQYDVSVDHARAGRRASGLYDRLQERRAEILGALERIQRGSYGRCVICGEPIPYRRLEVVPETRTCIGCCQ